MDAENQLISSLGGIAEFLPIPFWEEDFSAVKTYIDGLGPIPAADIPSFFKNHPQHLYNCIHLIRVVNINQPVMDLFGMVEREILQNGMMPDLMTEQTIDAFQREFTAILEKKTSLDFETSIRTATGDRRIMKIRWFVPPGFEENLSKVIVVMVDITDRYKAEEAERHSLQRLRQVIDLVPLMIFAKDLEGKFHLANRAISDALGTTVDELVGKSLDQFYPYEDTLVEWKDEDEEVILTGMPMRIEEEDFFDAKGELRILQTTKIPFTEFGSNEEILLGVSLDITESKRQERRLENYLAILQGVFDSSPDGIMVSHSDGRVRHYNERFAQIWGLPEEVLNAHDADPDFDEYYALLKNPDVLYSMIEEAKKFPDKSGEELIEFHDGRIVEVRSSHYNILNEYGGRVWFFRDITDKMSTENALMERNFELDSFVYRASHDLKAPLNSIMGLIEIMQGETNPDSQQLYLNLMNRSVVKLDAFIRNLADFSRNRRTGIAQAMIEFPEMIHGAIEQLTFMEGADQVRFEKDLVIQGDFYSDPVRLQVILDNLVSNAIKYRDAQRPDRWVKIKVKVSPQEAVLEVSDNGIGIEADQHEKVFRMFYRAHVQAYGAGLGLYVVQQAVRVLQGRIDLESAPGVGTTVRVSIPATIKW